MSTDNHLPKDNSSVPGRTNDPETFAKFASVKSYQDYLTDKDNPVVMVTLTVNDQGFLDNTTFETYLTQHTNAHDEFTIVVSDTAIDDFYGQVMRNSKNLLGEPITIHIHHKGAVVQSFKGIIAQVSDKRNEGGGYGNLYISGYGLSILLDSGEECQSYEDKTLPEIIAEATNEYGDVKVNTKGMVNTKYKIPYVVQYKESDYQFIQRLARRYGEFFFYDGTQLQFNNETRQTVQLSEGDDLIEVAFELKIQPQHFSYLSYGIEKGEVEEKNTKNIRLQDKGNPFQFAAVKASEKVFTKKPKVPYNAFTEEFRGDYLADNVRREKESREQLMEVRGRSRNPNLRIGGFVKLKDINDKPMESYRIIDIKHHQSGYDYENEFVAIPDVYIAYYYDREALPRAEQQIARVTDNNDPKGLGRVRVQFIWQVAKKLQTPWIRVVQPHAGGGKGFYFIPEIGEEVWVDFEDQNAERPFVIGSNYNGKEYSPFHNTNNDIKAIQTRSGVKIKIDDSNGSLFLEDPSGNNIYMDGKQKISFNGATLEFNAQRIIMNATERTEITTNDYILNALSKIYVFSTWFKQQINGFMHLFSNSALINTTNAIDIEAKEAKLLGTEKSIVHSDNVAVVNSLGTAELKGKQGNKYTQKAEEVPSTPVEEIGLAVVHFRPLDTWRGEFGFDWFRDENDIFYGYPNEIDFLNVEGGYSETLRDRNGRRRDMDRNEAYDQLRTQYQRIPTKGDNFIMGIEYYVPYLSLFSKEFVDTLETLPNPPKVMPKYEVNLQIIFGILKDIDRLEFDYDKKLFKIDKDVLSNNIATEGLEKGETIKITCLKDLDSDKEIRIYAYPEIETIANEIGTNGKPFPDIDTHLVAKIYQFLNRKLAGKIIVLKNDSTARGEQKIVLVRVITDTLNTRSPKTGNFTPEERMSLYNTFYQALVIPIVEGEYDDINKSSIFLDLSNNNEFKVRIDARTNRRIKGAFVDNSGKLDVGWYEVTGTRVTNNFMQNLQTLFFNDRDEDNNLKNEKYKTGYFTIFSLEESVTKDRLLGRTDFSSEYNSRTRKIKFKGFRKNAIICNPIDRNKQTLSHEVLHGMGVFHIHREIDDRGVVIEPLIKYKNKKYIFPKGITTNIMAYYVIEAYSSWRWQWHIINPKISEK